MAALFLGQCLPAQLRDNLPGWRCQTRLAFGEPHSSTYCLAGKLANFLLEHPTHHTLVLLTDFPWASMSLEEVTNFINLLVTNTRSICAHHHTHPSSLPCKLICFNLFHN